MIFSYKQYLASQNDVKKKKQKKDSSPTKKMSYNLLQKIISSIISADSEFVFVKQNLQIRLGDEFMDIHLLFYHKYLKCHVLVNIYPEYHYCYYQKMDMLISYYNQTLRTENENRAIGIYLFLENERLKVQYVNDGIDEGRFVQNYVRYLPPVEELSDLLNLYEE